MFQLFKLFNRIRNGFRIIAAVDEDDTTLIGGNKWENRRENILGAD